MRQALHRHGAPRPAERDGARARQAVRADARRVQGPGARARTNSEGVAVERRRQVPPRRVARDRRRRGGGAHRLDAAEPQPSGGHQPGARGHGARGRHRRRAPGRAGVQPAMRCCPSSFTATPPFPARASSPRRSTCTASGLHTGGTIHIIANNQLGFTTEPDESVQHAVRQRPRARVQDSDLPRERRRPGSLRRRRAAGARLSRAVPAATCSSTLVGYRRYGHNEGDEPAFTQPSMYAEIAAHPTVARSSGRGRSRRAARSSPAGPRRCSRRGSTRCSGRSTRSMPSKTWSSRRRRSPRPARGRRRKTAVPIDAAPRAQRGSPGACRPGSPLNRKLERNARAAAPASSPSRTSAPSTGRAAEDLAFASILEDGVADPLSRARTSSAAPSAIVTPCSARPERRPRLRAAAAPPAGAGGLRDPQQPAQRERRGRASSTATTSRRRSG